MAPSSPLAPRLAPAQQCMALAQETPEIEVIFGPVYGMVVVVGAAVVVGASEVEEWEALGRLVPQLARRTVPTIRTLIAAVVHLPTLSLSSHVGHLVTTRQPMPMRG